LLEISVDHKNFDLVPVSIVAETWEALGDRAFLDVELIEVADVFLREESLFCEEKKT